MALSLGIMVFDGVEELDFVGPWEVFTMAETIGLPIVPTLISLDKKRVTCAKKMIIEAHHDLQDAPATNAILVPGGPGTRRVVHEPTAIDWLRQRGSASEHLLSVCTGSVVLGKTGLLNNKRVTTHWDAFDFLKEHAPDVIQVKDQRVVKDENYFGSAGVSAGIDMSLTFLGDKFGIDAAKDVQKWMEYHPEPPFGS